MTSNGDTVVKSICLLIELLDVKDLKRLKRRITKDIKSKCDALPASASSSKIRNREMEIPRSYEVFRYPKPLDIRNL